MEKWSDALHYIRMIGGDILGFAYISLQVIEINGSIRVASHFQTDSFPISHTYSLRIAI